MQSSVSFARHSSSGNHSVTVAADVHCSQAVRQGAEKPALSATASSEPPNLDEIAKDSNFTVTTTKMKQSKTKIKPSIRKTVINTVLPSSFTLESYVSFSSYRTQPENPACRHTQSLPRRHDQTEQSFHSKFQPIE
jgi:hypothetical protein